jgi:tRNA (guanine37-N1)-methyltransferase
MRSLSVAVPKKKAEPIRRRLLAQGILRKDLHIQSDSRNVYLPVNQRVDVGYPVDTRDFVELEENITDYRVLVDVPEELRDRLPSSFDVVGSIAVVKMSEEALPHARDIGKAIMATQKSVKTVCLDSGVVDEHRTRSVKVIAGEKTTETAHREYGLVFRMDIAKVFFSPRLSTERETVADQVQPGEVVVDMFAGIGPFSLMIARSRSPKVVYAIDVNPDAVRYLEENIRLNKAGSVVPILGDARDEIAKLETADRIIMNLPHHAWDFLPDAVRALRPGGTVHYFEIMEEDDLERRLGDLKDVAVREGRVLKVLACRKVKSYSPTMGFFAFDLVFL